MSNYIAIYKDDELLSVEYKWEGVLNKIGLNKQQCSAALHRNGKTKTGYSFKLLNDRARKDLRMIRFKKYNNHVLAISKETGYLVRTYHIDTFIELHPNEEI